MFKFLFAKFCFYLNHLFNTTMCDSQQDQEGQQLSQQQGEEEFNQVANYPQNTVSNRGTISIESVFGHLDLNKKASSKTQEELLAQTYYFHSKQFENARRYSVAGKFVKVEGNDLTYYPDGYKLVLGFAIVSNKDRFSRSEGRRIALEHLNDDSKNYEYIVDAKELLVPGKTFVSHAKELVPVTVFDAKMRHALLKHARSESSYQYKGVGEPTEEDKKQLNNMLDVIRKLDDTQFMCDVQVEEELICEYCKDVVYYLDPLITNGYDRSKKYSNK